MLKCSHDVLVNRYRARWNSGKRHPGHVDHLSDDEELAAILDRDDQALHLGGQVIEIDTTDLSKVDYTELFKAINDRLRMRKADV